MLVALFGAQAALALGIPLPWMLGPLILTAAARIGGAPIRCARPLRNAGQWVIGASLGLYFTPQVIGELAQHTGAILAGMVFALVLAVIGTWVLRRFAGLDFDTAWFASAIGGASEMSTLAERYGARVDRVASVHSLRVLIVVVTVPFVFQALGVIGSDPAIPGPRVVRYDGLALLVFATCAVALVFRRLRIPNPWVLGPMAVGIALTSQGIELSALPDAVLRAGQLLIGWSLGDRYRPGFVRAAPRLLACVAVQTFVLMALSAAFGWALARLSGLAPITTILATTPGGIAEMTFTAKVLQLGVPTVTAFHATRMVFVVVITGPLYRLLSPRFGA